MIDQAVNALKNGGMVLLHDNSGRENEIDIVIHASFVSPDTISFMRKQGGGLICLAIGKSYWEHLELPFMTDLMQMSNDVVKSLIPERTAYGDKPAFSVAINHRDTFTGITDNDRALTITEFEKVKDKSELGGKFYSPGHVPLLLAKDLSQRRGHTELSIELAKRAGISQAMVLCEMMADDHNALSIGVAQEIADEYGLLLIDGGLL